MKKKVISILERVGMTFVGAFLAVYLTGAVAGGSAFSAVKDLSLLDKAATAGIAALVPLVGGLVGASMKRTDGASVVIKKDDEEK